MSAAHRPKLVAGRNIAMKIPSHEYEATVRFYRDIVGLRQIHHDTPDVVFEFGDSRLWLDKVDHFSRAEIWLELQSDDVGAAAEYLANKGIIRRDDIEPLPQGFSGFWIANPAGIIHLVCAE